MADYKQPQLAVELSRDAEGSPVGQADPRASSVLERLSQLEGRVGGQLDQLVQLQQQQVKASVHSAEMSLQPSLTPVMHVAQQQLIAGRRTA